jgi:large subunit ribosomal protein L4
MAQAKAINLSAAEKALGVELFKNRRASQALHEAVTAYRAARRSGTHSTKTKGTVDLSGAKPWNQKGTGRARAGYKASPVWRGGGVAFGPHPRSYRKDIPKTVLRTALRRAISDLATQGKLHSGTAPALKAAKTTFSSCIDAVNILTLVFFGIPSNTSCLVHVVPSSSDT